MLIYNLYIYISIYIYLYTSFPHPLIPVIPAFELYWFWNCKGFQVPRCEMGGPGLLDWKRVDVLGAFCILGAPNGCHDVGMAVHLLLKPWNWWNVPTESHWLFGPPFCPWIFDKGIIDGMIFFRLLEVLLVSGMLAFSFPTLYLVHAYGPVF